MKFQSFFKQQASKDILVVICFGIGVFSLSSIIELNEKFLIVTRPFEAYQVDELPVTLFSLLIGMAWFSWKRASQTILEMELRLTTQKNLEKVLRENKLLSHKYITLQEEERRLLARELHEELGQGLNAIKIDAVNIRDESLKDTPVKHSAQSIIEVSSHIYQLVRNLTHRLRPIALDELGLSSAVKHLIDSWQKRHSNVKCIYSPSGKLDGLSESVNITIFRLVQEGLTNITKHARARNINVSINRVSTESGSDSVNVEMQDDGVGIQFGEKQGGLGLVGIRERVESVGGQFTVASQQLERGTNLKAVITL